MSERFLLFKKRARLFRLIGSLIAGISLGLFVSGSLLLLKDLEVITFKSFLCYLIGAASFAVCFILHFLIFKVSDMTIAKKLDDEFCLDQRAETSVQFSTQNSSMLELQRQDTDRALNNVPLSALKFKKLWLYIIVLFFGALVFASSFVYKPTDSPVDPIEKVPFKLTELQAEAIEELIAYIDSSEMFSPYREEISASVSALLDSLKVCETVEEMTLLYEDTVYYILERTDASSYTLEICEALWSLNSEPMKKLSQLVNSYSWPKADEFDKFSSALTDFRNSLYHPDSSNEGYGPEKVDSETNQLFTKASTDIALALTSSGVPAEDLLCGVLVMLASADVQNDDGTRIYGLSKLAALISEKGYTDTQRELDATLSYISSELFFALEKYRTNIFVGEYAVTTLADILDAPLPDFERPNLIETGGDDSSVSGDSEGGGGGAIGSGAVYGSDDLVLDPYTNKFVEYGTILDKYYALMFGKLNEGEYTEEEKAALEKYFSILYGGFEDEKNDGM